MRPLSLRKLRADIGDRARLVRHGWELLRTGAATRPSASRVEPVWPLPRASPMSPMDIVTAFDAFAELHYPFEFVGGPALRARYVVPNRIRAGHHFQRFAHFMPTLLEACGGSLHGKRVLDIACNAGFWSIQCALLGARDVVGFDPRPEVIAQARLVEEIVRTGVVRFERATLSEVSAALLGGRFDVVLCLGLLYHLPEPLDALRRILALSDGVVVLDTMIAPDHAPVVRLRWDEPTTVLAAATPSVVAFPSRRAIRYFARHLAVRDMREIPLSSMNLPRPYLVGRRATWILRV